MHRIKKLAVGSVAVLLFLSTPAAAHAHEFSASKTGSLSGSSLNTQVFTTKAGKVECQKMKASGEVTALKAETQLVVEQYENCSYFGFIAKVSPAEYMFNANGTVSLVKLMTWEVPECLITFPAQSGLSAVTYETMGKGVEIGDSITNLESEGVGKNCTYAKEKAGTLTGNALIELVGGEWKWA